MQAGGLRHGAHERESSGYVDFCFHVLSSDKSRGVAQLGSALALGARCRRFKSCHPDQFDLLQRIRAFRSRDPLASPFSSSVMSAARHRYLSRSISALRRLCRYARPIAFAFCHPSGNQGKLCRLQRGVAMRPMRLCSRRRPGGSGFGRRMAWRESYQRERLAFQYKITIVNDLFHI